MTLTVSNNSAVAFASHYLGKNQKALQMSIKKLASGKKIVAPGDDPGTLSVSMKLNAAVTRLTGARNNVQNGISFMEVQDGMLETAGRIINRMAEMKGRATADPMRGDQVLEFVVIRINILIALHWVSGGHPFHLSTIRPRNLTLSPSSPSTYFCLSVSN